MTESQIDKIWYQALESVKNNEIDVRYRFAKLLMEEWPKFIQGKLVSMDVSTSEDDAGNRIWGKVYEVMLESGGSREDTILAIEEERNF